MRSKIVHQEAKMVPVNKPPSIDMLTHLLEEKFWEDTWREIKCRKNQHHSLEVLKLDLGVFRFRNQMEMQEFHSLICLRLRCFSKSIT